MLFSFIVQQCVFHDDKILVLSILYKQCSMSIAIVFSRVDGMENLSLSSFNLHTLWINKNETKRFSDEPFIYLFSIAIGGLGSRNIISPSQCVESIKNRCLTHLKQNQRVLTYNHSYTLEYWSNAQIVAEALNTLPLIF